MPPNPRVGFLSWIKLTIVSREKAIDYEQDQRGPLPFLWRLVIKVDKQSLRTKNTFAEILSLVIDEPFNGGKRLYN